MNQDRGVSLPDGMTYEQSPFGPVSAPPATDRTATYPPPPPLRPAPVAWGPGQRVQVPEWLPQYPPHVSPPPVVPPPMRPQFAPSYGVYVGIGRPWVWVLLTFMTCGLAFPGLVISLIQHRRKRFPIQIVPNR